MSQPMPESHDQVRDIKSLPALVKYLREELNWPIDSDDFEELTFEYAAAEFGLVESLTHEMAAHSLSGWRHNSRLLPHDWVSTTRS